MVAITSSGANFQQPCDLNNSQKLYTKNSSKYNVNDWVYVDRSNIHLKTKEPLLNKLNAVNLQPGHFTGVGVVWQEVLLERILKS